MTETALAEPVARIREAAPVLRAEASAGEASRALTEAAHAALARAGAFQLYVPRSLGGEETTSLTFLRTVREAARADGSAGWCAMISGVYGAFGGLLPSEGAKEVYGSGQAVLAGALSPMGEAVPVPGGYRLSGRWTFGSNSPHANWFVGAAIVMEGGAPVMLAEGRPKITLAFFPRSEVTIIDTWTATGLRGTGSHDYAVQEIFVPAARTFWFSDPPVEPGPLYALPVIAGFGPAIAAVAVGIAYHMLDAFVALAPLKRPVLSPLTLQEKTNVHDRVGVALATIEAADAYLERAVSDAWAVVEGGGRLDWRQRGRLWLAGTHAAQLSTQTVESLYTVAGASAVFAVNEFDRCLRDARTAAQHIMTQVFNYEVAGKQALGLDVRDSPWSFDDRGDSPN